MHGLRQWRQGPQRWAFHPEGDASQSYYVAGLGECVVGLLLGRKSTLVRIQYRYAWKGLRLRGEGKRPLPVQQPAGWGVSSPGVIRFYVDGAGVLFFCLYAQYAQRLILPEPPPRPLSTALQLRSVNVRSRLPKQPPPHV